MEDQEPVTAADVGTAVGLVRAALRDVPDGGWSVPAGTLAWSCWETVEHMADDLFSYAVQIAAADPPRDGYLPIVAEPARPGGPASAIAVAPGTGTAGLLLVLEACGGLLAGAVAAAPPHRRAYHPLGVADPAGFAAMGVVEVLVHGYDVATGLGRAWDPPAGLCARVLARLFPDVPAGHPPWPTLVWATGRGELPGRPVRTRWRWYAEPRA